MIDANEPSPKANILVVDDQPDNILAIEAILEGLGQTIVSARSGREALRHLLNTEFAVVLLDVQMPGMDGYETATLIRDRERSRLTPIIFLTAALATETNQIRGYEVGAVDYLVKPFPPGVLTSKVSVFVELAKHREMVRRQADMEAASRMKDEFLATLSHELRTPLNAILGWTQMLLSGTLDATQTTRALKTVERNALGQSELIKDILDVSRIVSGKLQLNLVPTDLRPIIEAALDTVRPSADAKEIALNADLEAGVGPVSADVGRIQQIAWNLLTNAIKFTPKGGRVDVRLSRLGSRVSLTVADNGVGISAEFLPFVFDRFRQSDSSSTRAHGGLGLGLAIVHHLVELHGGRIDAKSAGHERGATFTALFPLMSVVVADAPERSESHELSKQLGSGVLNGVRLLVVDDDKDARDLVTAVLAGSGAQVETASSVREAMHAIQKVRPDVVVSDIEMPGEDGYALIRELRALAPEQGGKIPTVALTAYARTEDRTRLLKAGFQSHLAKPVQPAELVAVVNSLARQARAQAPD